jgi:transposase
MVNLAMNREDLTPILLNLLSLSASPLKAVETDFAVDSTGFRTTQFCMYADAKYGLRRQHKWVKAHACVGVKTNVITALAITGENAGDSPQFPDLVKTTAEAGFNVKEITADKAYSSRDNYAVVKELGGQAYIPFRSNAKCKQRGSSAWRKAFLMFQLKQDEFMAHYHQRSNVESAFASIKKKFGDSLKSKNKTAQTNELLCKIIAYNVVVLIHEIYELGIEPDFSSGGNNTAQFS